MSDYIRRQDVFTALNVACVTYDARGQRAIENIPSIKIVRCRECKDFHENYPWDMCRRVGMPTEADNFCSWGERKD